MTNKKNKKLAIIHTTPLTIAPLKELAMELLPGCEVINLMDDSILPQLAATGGDLSSVEARMLSYASIAESLGADCVLSACSSVGELVAAMETIVTVPIVRIDEAMAELAVAKGSRIGVAATLNTTMRPTLALLEKKASEAGKLVQFVSVLAEGAYRKLLAGDNKGHDEELYYALKELVEQTDIVVLAQASMARIARQLPEELQGRCLTSPRLGMERAIGRMNRL